MNALDMIAADRRFLRQLAADNLIDSRRYKRVGLTEMHEWSHGRYSAYKLAAEVVAKTERTLREATDMAISPALRALIHQYNALVTDAVLGRDDTFEVVDGHFTFNASAEITGFKAEGGRWYEADSEIPEIVFDLLADEVSPLNPYAEEVLVYA